MVLPQRCCLQQGAGPPGQAPRPVVLAPPLAAGCTAGGVWRGVETPSHPCRPCPPPPPPPPCATLGPGSALVPASARDLQGQPWVQCCPQQCRPPCPALSNAPCPPLPCPGPHPPPPLAAGRGLPPNSATERYCVAQVCCPGTGRSRLHPPGLWRVGLWRVALPLWVWGSWWCGPPYPTPPLCPPPRPPRAPSTQGRPRRVQQPSCSAAQSLCHPPACLQRGRSVGTVRAVGRVQWARGLGRAR